jgi:hypothetical protein
MSDKRKILVCVEGRRGDVRLMNRLFRTYGIDSHYEIVSYNTNIYALYSEMFLHQDPRDMDLLQVLKSREQDVEKKKLFDDDYTDVLLIFDMDPQDPSFSPEKLLAMTSHFSESTDTGKLYINYPMIESFYHMKSIPDESYDDRYVTLDELEKGLYKHIVSTECFTHDYKKFAALHEDLSIVIKQNIEKSCRIVGAEYKKTHILPDQKEILARQLFELVSDRARVAVLCTCLFFIHDYNSALLADREVSP